MSNMKTINLLPKPRQQELRYETMLRGILVIAALSLVSFGLVFLAQFGVKLYLQVQADSQKKEIADLQALINRQENAQVKARVKAVNDLISDYKNFFRFFF